MGKQQRLVDRGVVGPVYQGGPGPRNFRKIKFLSVAFFPFMRRSQWLTENSWIYWRYVGIGFIWTTKKKTILVGWSPIVRPVLLKFIFEMLRPNGSEARKDGGPGARPRKNFCDHALQIVGKCPFLWRSRHWKERQNLTNRRLSWEIFKTELKNYLEIGWFYCSCMKYKQGSLITLITFWYLHFFKYSLP